MTLEAPKKSIYTGSSGKQKSPRLVKTAVLLVCFILILTVCGLIIENTFIGLFIAIIQLMVIFAYAKLSLFSVFPALLTFCLFQEYAAVNGWKVYGLLGAGYVPIYFGELKTCTYVLNLIILYLILFTNCLNNEQELLKTSFRISPEASLIFLTLALTVTLLIFPSFPNLATFSPGNPFK